MHVIRSRIAFPCFAAATLAIVCCDCASADGTKLVPGDYSKVKIGMKLSEAQKSLNAVGSCFLKYSPLEKRMADEVREEGDWSPKSTDNDPNRRWIWIGPDCFIFVRVREDGVISDRMLVRFKAHK